MILFVLVITPAENPLVIDIADDNGKEKCVIGCHPPAHKKDVIDSDDERKGVCMSKSRSTVTPQVLGGLQNLQNPELGLPKQSYCSLDSGTCGGNTATGLGYSGTTVAMDPGETGLWILFVHVVFLILLPSTCD